MQHCVRRRRPVARDDFEGRVMIGKDLQIVQNVQQRRIDHVAIAGAKIAQQMIDVAQTRVVIGAAVEICGRQRLPGMGMHEAQAARPRGVRCERICVRCERIGNRDRQNVGIGRQVRERRQAREGTANGTRAQQESAPTQLRFSMNQTGLRFGSLFMFGDDALRITQVFYPSGPGPSC